MAPDPGLKTLSDLFKEVYSDTLSQLFLDPEKERHEEFNKKLNEVFDE
jgi:hypothetical protein